MLKVKNALCYCHKSPSGPLNARVPSYCLCTCARLESTHRRTWLKNGEFISSVVLERTHEYYDFFSAQATYKCTHRQCARPTLNIFERFLKGSLRGLYERSIYERTFRSADSTRDELTSEHFCLSEPIKNLQNHAISNTRGKQPTEGEIYTRNIQCLVACAMLEL